MRVLFFFRLVVDFQIVLNMGLLSITNEELKSIQSEMILVNGEIVYERSKKQ